MIKKVLIVDDISANLYMLETLLKGYGFEVISAENGKVALDKARLNPPDLIVTDILMPVMDGYALCRQWKSDNKLKHIPLVFYTATYTESKDEKFALSLGADCFILKPQEPDIFMNILKEVLGEKYTARQVVTKPLGEEMEFFKQYNEILFKKLEKKVTDLEIANQNLKILEEKYRSLFEHLQDAIFLTKPDGSILEVNNAACKMFGRSVDEIRAAGRNGLVDVTDPCLQVALKERAQAGAARAEITMLRANGEKFPVDIISTMFTDMNGQQKTSMIIRDITERKRAEDTLRKSEARFRSYFELPLIGIAITSPEKGWIEVNNRLSDILGYSVQELKGMSWSELTYPEDLDADVEQFNRVLAGEIDSYMIDKRFIRKGGEVIWTSLAAGCVRKQDGTVDYFVVLLEDITDRKQAEEALRESEKKYRDLYNFLPIPVYEMDFEANIISANRAIYETFRGTEEDLKKGFKGWQLLSPEDVAKSAKNIERLLKGEQTGGTEYTLMRLDGSVFPAMVISSVIYKDGKPVGLRGAVVDITDRKRAEEVLRQSENKYRLLADNIHDVIFVLDMNLNYTYVSPSTKILRGYEPEEVMKQSPSKTLTPSSWDLVTKTIAEAMELEKEHREINISRTLQLEMRRKDGTTVWTEVNISVIRNENQQPVGILGVTRDITERRRASEALRDSEEQYRLVVENAKESIIITQDMKVVFVNSAAIGMVGYSKEILISKSFTDFIHPDDLNMVVEHHIKRIKGDEVPPVYSFRVIGQDGTVIWCEINAAVIQWKGRPATLNFLNNITERKKAEEELQKTLDSLKKAVGTTIQVLVSALEARDPYTAGHQLRVAHLACAIATEMGLPQDKIDGIRMAGSIHDIGKLSIPAEILVKPTKLTDIEFSLIKEHPQSGYEMLKDVESPWPLAEIVQVIQEI